MSRWRTPRDWYRTRLAMQRSQAQEPWTCGACGRYLYGYIRHWHYTLRWISGWKEPA
jgi:hypothetical protein